jgi:outer membrane protein assembly factor BamB
MSMGLLDIFRKKDSTKKTGDFAGGKIERGINRKEIIINILEFPNYYDTAIRETNTDELFRNPDYFNKAIDGFYSTHSAYCDGCRFQFSNEALMTLNLFGQGSQGSNIKMDCSKQMHDILSGKCPQCGHTKIKIIINNNHDVKNLISEEITEEDVQNIKRYWQKEARFWWQSATSSSASCYLCHCNIPRNEGYFNLGWLLCEECIDSKFLKNAVDELKKNPTYFGVGLLSKVRTMNRSESVFEKNKETAIDPNDTRLEDNKEINKITDNQGIRSLPYAMYRSNLQHTGEYKYGGIEPTNTELWRFKTGGEVSSTPVEVGGVIYFGSDDHLVYAIDAITGKEKWRLRTGSCVQSSPAVSNGVVYIGSLDYNLYAIDAVTGMEKWRFKTGGGIHSSPAVFDGIVYIGSYDDYVYAIDAVTGMEKWRFQTGIQVTPSPAVVDGVVYIGSFDQYMYAIDVVTGMEKWRFKTGGGIRSSPAISNGVVYIASWDNNLYAIDTLTGKEKWHFVMESIYSLSSPAVSNGVVYIGSQDCHLYAIDAITGKEKWRFTTKSTVSSSPAVLNDVVYFGSCDNNLYAIDAVTGMEKWRFTAGGSLNSPVISNGIIYVGSSDNYLYAVGTR